MWVVPVLIPIPMIVIAPAITIHAPLSGDVSDLVDQAWRNGRRAT